MIIFFAATFSLLMLDVSVANASYVRSKYSSSLSFSSSSIVIVVLGIIFFLLCCYLQMRRNTRKKEEEAERRNAYRAFNKASDKGIDATTSKSAYEQLEVMKEQYSILEPKSSGISKSAYKEDMNDVLETAKILEREEWERKADKILDQFIDAYFEITEGDFSDVDKIYRTKAKCVSLWQKYMTLPEEKHILLYPKTYIREYLGDEYDPCMENSDSLKKKLDECIAVRRPEYKRKTSLLKAITEAVAESENVMRTKLVDRLILSGYQKDEILACCRSYRILTRKKRFILSSAAGLS